MKIAMLGSGFIARLLSAINSNKKVSATNGGI